MSEPLEILVQPVPGTVKVLHISRITAPIRVVATGKLAIPTSDDRQIVCAWAGNRPPRFYDAENPGVEVGGRPGRSGGVYTSTPLPAFRNHPGPPTQFPQLISDTLRILLCREAVSVPPVPDDNPLRRRTMARESNEIPRSADVLDTNPKAHRFIRSRSRARTGSEGPSRRDKPEPAPGQRPTRASARADPPRRQSPRDHGSSRHRP